MPPAKNSSKQKIEKQNRKLTDFFSPKPKTPALQRHEAEHTAAGIEVTESGDESRPAEQVPTAFNATKKQHLAPLTPSIRASRSSISHRSASTVKCKTPVDSEDSEDDTSGTRPIPVKPYTKPRNFAVPALPSKKSYPDSEEVAATSQSEEMELELVTSRGPEDAFPGYAMHLDSDTEEAALPQPETTRTSSLSPLVSPGWPATPLMDIEPPSSSPLDAPSSRLPSPLIIDNQTSSVPQGSQETVTERFIRETKERAYKKMLETEAKPLPNFEEDLESDDEELFIMPVAKIRKSPKRSPPAQTASVRYNLRKHDVTTVSQPQRDKENRPSERRKYGPNPVNAMLREKQQDEKRGIDSEAFRRAEELLQAEYDGGRLLEEGYDPDDPFNDKPLLKDRDFDSTLIIDDNERERLLGAENSKVIGRLLEDDKRSALHKNSEGVPFWRDSAEDVDAMDIDELVSGSWPEQSSLGPRLTLLKHILDENAGIQQDSVILTSGVIASWPEPELGIAVQQLIQLALFPSPDREQLQASASWALLQIWAVGQNHPVCLPLSVILHALLRLGARRDRFDLLSVASSLSVPSSAGKVDLDSRTVILRRAISLMARCAASHHIAQDDTPDVLVLLLEIGMDPSTSPDIKLEITHVINGLCNSLAPCTEITPLEIQLCNLVLKLLETYDPLNRRACLSFLSSGCDRTARMAKYIALCILLDIKQLDGYDGTMKVERLLPILTPHFNEEACGKFDLNSKSTYEHITAFTHILSVALSDVDSLVVEEAARRKAQNLQLSDVLGQEYITPLTKIRNALEVLHGKITDTRAAMLDRTQAKAALKTLSIRLWLQTGSSEAIHRRGPFNNGRDASSRMKPQPKMKQGSLQHFFKS